MKSLLDKEHHNEILSRLDKLIPESNATWGKMNVAQMLKHVNNTMKIATGEVVIAQPPWHKRVLFSFFKSMLYNDRPWKQNLPTAPELRVASSDDFHIEKTALLSSIEKFTSLPFPGGKMKHPVFGNFTKEQWGKMQYKHLDHHLRQFGV